VKSENDTWKRQLRNAGYTLIPLKRQRLSNIQGGQYYIFGYLNVNVYKLAPFSNH
jgi:hypothetical protein